MQFRVYQVSVRDSSGGIEELNAFLRGHRVVRVEREFVDEGSNSFWAFCVEYLSGPEVTPRVFGKVDYKEVLTPEQFSRFARLRALRKELSDKEAIPPYAVFTNEQLAEMAKLEPASKTGMQGIPGIGTARVEKYGEVFLAVLQAPAERVTDEKSRAPS